MIQTCLERGMLEAPRGRVDINRDTKAQSFATFILGISRIVCVNSCETQSKFVGLYAGTYLRSIQYRPRVQSEVHLRGGHHKESKSMEGSYLARLSEPQNPEREVSPEENRLSTFVAAESDSREIASLRELAGESSRFGAGSSEMRSSESKGATMFKLSISLRTRANSASFCCRSSYASFIALLPKGMVLARLRSVHLHLLALNPGRYW